MPFFPSFFSFFHRACLVATIQSTGAAQSTIKLVATNLIANGNIWEGMATNKDWKQLHLFHNSLSKNSLAHAYMISGVQLLCLIGKGLDACRYLLSYNLWDSAVWLAKAVLPPSEMHEVMKKFADHLLATGHRVNLHLHKNLLKFEIFSPL